MKLKINKMHDDVGNSRLLSFTALEFGFKWQPYHKDSPDEKRFVVFAVRGEVKVFSQTNVIKGNQLQKGELKESSKRDVLCTTIDVSKLAEGELQSQLQQWQLLNVAWLTDGTEYKAVVGNALIIGDRNGNVSILIDKTEKNG